MSRESILRIREVEAEAEAIIARARAEAKETLANAEREGRELLGKTEADGLAASAQMLAEIRERTEQLGVRLEEDSRTECAELQKSVQLRRKAAEKVIMRGVEAKCRFVQ